jgi:hypothetical protein
MPLSQQEIIDYASRYVDSKEIVDFPFEGDLFCLIGRDLPEGKMLKDEEGWGFQGYGVCLGYTLDNEAKPLGKWLWMHFASLTVFPPAEQVFKLQPPHVVKGRFQNPARSKEFRIIKVKMGIQAGNGMTVPSSQVSGDTGDSVSTPPSSVEGKIVKFRRKKTFNGGGNNIA